MPPQKDHFTDEQKAFIRDNCHAMTYQQVADHLGKSKKNVERVARIMGVSYYKTGNLHPNTIYPDSDVLRVRALRDKGMLFREIARILDVSVSVAVWMYYKRKTKADTIARRQPQYPPFISCQLTSDA